MSPSSHLQQGPQSNANLAGTQVTAPASCSHHVPNESWRSKRSVICNPSLMVPDHYRQLLTLTGVARHFAASASDTSCQARCVMRIRANPQLVPCPRSHLLLGAAASAFPLNMRRSSTTSANSHT
jgi:hypothetical protein